MLATILAEINGTLGIGACLGAGVALFAVIVCVLSLFL